MTQNAMSKYWCFTLNNPTTNINETLDKRIEEGTMKYYVYQLEKGENGTPHYQGYIELDKRSKLSAMKKIMYEAHWEMRKGNQEQCIKYCTKEESRLEGPWSSGELVQDQTGKRSDLRNLQESIKANLTYEELIDEHPEVMAKYPHFANTCIAIQKRKTMKLPDYPLHKWQQELVDYVEGPVDDRKIRWYIDYKGRAGKSHMAKKMLKEKNAFWSPGGKCADLALAYQYQDIVVFDFSRSKEDCVNYDIIEQFKNGLIFSPKYESAAKCCDPPHVIVFSNFAPDLNKLTDDRWDIIKLTDPKYCKIKDTTVPGYESSDEDN